MNLQRFFDRIIDITILRFIPESVTPNHLTYSRICSLPIIYYLLDNEFYVWGWIMFSLSALTDAVDGALARTRNKITEFGTVLDPLADKGLIILAAMMILPQYIGWETLYVLLGAELINAIINWGIRYKTKINPPANWASKTKMVVQSIALIIVFFGIFSGNVFWFDTTIILIYISSVFCIWGIGLNIKRFIERKLL